MYKCKICEKEFEKNLSLTNHLKSHNKQKINCEICGKEFSVNGIKNHVDVAHNGKIQGNSGKKFTEETKQKISSSMKTFLSNTLDHPWKNKISPPCEQLKSFLKDKNIDFEEEITLLKELGFYYSIDIYIPIKNLVIEVNGDQHYSNGKLTEYFQIRHDRLVKNGFRVLELPYKLAYNHDFCLKLIENFEEQKFDYTKYIGNLEEKIKIVRESNINFLKRGWMKELAKILGTKKTSNKNMVKWLEKNIPDFAVNCYQHH